MKKYYKAFDKNFQCRGFQYEVGKTYKHVGETSLCDSGFHACENPLDCLSYYNLIGSKFALVEVVKPKKNKEGDSKIVTAEINIKAEISLPDFIKNSVDYLIDITKGKDTSGNGAQEASSGEGAKQASSGYSAQQASSGNYAKQASSGYGAQQASNGYGAQQASSGSHAKQASSGYSAQQASSGNYAKQASSGYGAQQASNGYGAQQASSGEGAKQASSGNGAQQASSGDDAQHICEGKKSVIASSGRCTKAKGIKGTWISLAEYKGGECVGFATGCIGKEKLKPDTWYRAENGKLVVSSCNERNI
jgi:hypothetical protein